MKPGALPAVSCRPGVGRSTCNDLCIFTEYDVNFAPGTAFITENVRDGIDMDFINTTR